MLDMGIPNSMIASNLRFNSASLRVIDGWGQKIFAFVHVKGITVTWAI